MLKIKNIIISLILLTKLNNIISTNYTQIPTDEDIKRMLDHIITVENSNSEKIKNTIETIDQLMGNYRQRLYRIVMPLMTVTTVALLYILIKKSNITNRLYNQISYIKNRYQKII
jgi:hypothetical protein